MHQPLATEDNTVTKSGNTNTVWYMLSSNPFDSFQETALRFVMILLM